MNAIALSHLGRLGFVAIALTACGTNEQATSTTVDAPPTTYATQTDQRPLEPLDLPADTETAWPALPADLQTCLGTFDIGDTPALTIDHAIAVTGCLAANATSTCEQDTWATKRSAVEQTLTFGVDQYTPPSFAPCTVTPTGPPVSGNDMRLSVFGSLEIPEDKAVCLTGKPQPDNASEFSQQLAECGLLGTFIDVTNENILTPEAISCLNTPAIEPIELSTRIDTCTAGEPT